jgi:hypothetical protein
MAMRAAVFILVSTALLVGGCAPMFECENTVTSSVVSPDGQRRAVVFSRGCGATTPESVQVSVLSGRQTLRGAGNAFVTTHAAVEVSWMAEDQLQITYGGRAEIFQQHREVNGVSILYRSRSAP